MLVYDYYYSICIVLVMLLHGGEGVAALCKYVAAY